MNAQLVAIDPLQEAEERLWEERAKLRTEHATLVKLDAATHAADGQEQQIIALNNEERDAVTQWAESGAGGKMPVPDLARREALMKKFAKEQATASAARAAYTQAQARYVELAKRCERAEGDWRRVALQRQIDHANQLRKEMLAHLAGAELILQEVQAFRLALMDPSMTNLPEAGLLLHAMIHAANITNGELMDVVKEKVPGLLAQAKAALTPPTFDDAN